MHKSRTLRLWLLPFDSDLTVPRLTDTFRVNPGMKKQTKRQASLSIIHSEIINSIYKKLRSFSQACSHNGFPGTPKVA
jgi:hypothetical protein